MTQNTYNPGRLLDEIIQRMQLKNDAALARLLEVAPPMISKMRNHRLPVSASMLIRMHEATGVSVGDLRALMGDRRTKYRLSSDDWGTERREAFKAKKHSLEGATDDA